MRLFHGRWRTPVGSADGALVLNGQTIRLTHEKTIKALPLTALGVDLVIDCTGVFRPLFLSMIRNRSSCSRSFCG